MSCELSSGSQLICGLCVSSSGLHVCCLERLDHPNVPVPGSPPALLELSHCQVISLSLLVLPQSNIRIHFLIFRLDTQAFTWQPLTVWIRVLIPCVVSLHWYLPVSSHDALLSGVGEFSGALCLKSQSPWWGIQSLRLRCSGWPELDTYWHLGLWCFQEPPKEDLTVSEKFQLVLDVAQRAQVRRDGQAEALLTIRPRCWTDLDNRCFKFPFHRICLGSWQTSWRKYGSEFFHSQTHPQLLTVATVYMCLVSV